MKIYKNYHSNGKLFNIGKIVNGKKEGYWKTYYRNGQLYSIGKYVNNKKEGLWKQYWDIDDIHKKRFNKKMFLQSIRFYSNGIKHGYYEFREITDEISCKGFFINGVKHGKWEQRKPILLQIN